MKILFIFCLLSVSSSYSSNHEEDKLFLQVTTWADKLGREFWDFGIVVTRKKQVLENYRNVNIELKDGDNLTNEIASNIKRMMDQKVEAVQRIMDYAGNAAADIDVDESFDYYNAKNLTNNLTDHENNKEESEMDENGNRDKRFIDDFQRDEEFDDEISEDSVDREPQIGEAKRVLKISDGIDEAQAIQQDTPKINYRKLNLTENPNFFNIPVNLDHSAVHVPSNVYDRSKEVISGIKWSENLDNIFKDNYQGDPTLSWQYFGSSTGFMRQFPAMIWKQDPVDLFDCRTRSWFIEAASSPKDIVVLVDKSGSMTGMRKEIAKHVVNNILDTLGNNDYVNIFTFSNVTEPLEACFNDTLVQANLGNVRAFKEKMDEGDNFKTENIANFSDAFVVAFKLLEDYRIGSRNKSGAGCNQAIMLITDGVQYNYKEIFEQYNWYTKNNNTFVHVRIFTYLIGREVSDVREVKWMACANQGYYVHLSTFAEVREQVLQYIPVMARPMVLKGDKPQPTWSPVYADVADPKLTNWLWVQRLRRDQRDKFLAHRHHKHTLDQDKKFVHQQKKSQDHYGDLQTYTLMTSVSMPVYDRRQNANFSEQIMVKEGHWVTIYRESRVANLLGVAGTDVPIHYIQQLMMPHLLGVNAYAFIVTNNGYILIHPDLRPVFQGILKPAYNRVDMAEIELPDEELEPREFHQPLKEMRKDIIKQKQGKKELVMKYHIDDMKRVVRGKRHYHYKGLDNTPFTLVISLPNKYGTMKIQSPVIEEIRRILAKETTLRQFFSGDNWKVHPDWHYCRYLAKDSKRFNSSEDELLDFFKRMEKEPWKWSDPECDRALVQSLVYDAKSTKWFDQKNTSKGDDRSKLIQTFGITVAFLATYSGLTRWQDFLQNVPEHEERPHFSDIHNRAIDEIWYKRAVEQHYIEENSFVYAVPFDAGDDNETLVTASHAVFLDKGGRKAPVAVVGYQFYRTAFLAKFENITNSCGQTDNLACYVLDNNGYVILSLTAEDTGRWFGHVKPGVMKLLVQERVYNPIRMYDYQAVCFPSEPEASFGTTNITPFNLVMQFLHWFITSLLYFLDLVSANTEETELPTTLPPDSPPTRANEKEFDRSVLIDKTKPTACDQERYLYELMHYKNEGNPFNKKMENCSRPFIAQRVPFSNLILLVVRTACKLDDSEDGDYYFSPEPIEIDYNQSLACRIREDDLYRRRYAKCINRHDNESQIQLCGGASYLTIPSIFTLIFLHLIVH